MKFITNNGEAIEGASPLELVKALRDGSRFSSDEPINDYMKGFAYRQKTYSGIDVRCNSVEEFVEDLASSGYWKRVE